MKIVDELNEFKSRNLSINNSLATIIKDSNEKEKKGTWIKQEEFKDVSKHLIFIVEQKDKVINNTFILTEDVLKLLRKKEILRYRNKVSDFNYEVKIRLGFDHWVKITSIFNRKIITGITFNKEDEIYLTHLKNVLKEVNITTDEFELLLRMKRLSNNEFHQDTTKTLDQELDSLEVSFPDELKDFKDPLKKLLFALKIWWN